MGLSSECIPFLELVHHLLEALNLIPGLWRRGTAFETNFALVDIGHKLLAGYIVRSIASSLEIGLRGLICWARGRSRFLAACAATSGGTLTRPPGGRGRGPRRTPPVGCWHA